MVPSKVDHSGEWLKDGEVVYTYIPNPECIIDISTEFELGKVRNKKWITSVSVGVGGYFS